MAHLAASAWFAALLLAAACTPAAAVWTCSTCYKYYVVPWGVGTLGPICMCSGGKSTAVFTWSGQKDHGVFQMPNDACPSNFTAYATDNYQDLAPSSTSGNFTWQLPAAAGDYWVTSQANQDCANGIKAQFRVISSSTRASLQLGAAGAAVLLGLLLALG
ncbi:hypothetical protein ABPG75_008930 [Micractinium tetrahymenae]